MALRILIVDDEPGIRDILRQYAEADGFAVVEAEDGHQALAIEDYDAFHAVVLDIMMPGADGWTVLREVRRVSDVPVLMLTARGEEYDRLYGFELGADDYIVKPFSPREVLARIRAIARRQGTVERLTFGRLVVEPEARTAMLDGEPVLLSPKEFDLLLMLVRHPLLVLSREQLLRGVWGIDYEGDARTVDTTIKQLRERLGDARTAIATVWGAGYKFVPEDR